MIKRTLEAAGFQVGEYFQLASIRDRKIVTRTFLNDHSGVEAANQWAGSEDRDYYICLNPLKTASHHKASIGDIAKVRCLLVDFDPAKTENDPDGLDEKKRGVALEAATRLRTSFGGVLVDSGRGYQLWIQHEDAVDRQAFLAAVKVWNKSKSVKIDATANIDRLARLPGTINRRTGRIACLMKT